MTFNLPTQLTLRHFAMLRHCLYLSYLLLFAGCATNVLHNPADFKAASEAEEIQKKINYLGILQEERAVQEKILSHELKVIDYFATARRNYALLNLMTSKEKNLRDNLEARIKDRQKALVGSNLPKLLNGIAIGQLLPPDIVTCGVGLNEIEPLDKNQKPAYTGPGPWAIALDRILRGCSEELLREAEAYNRNIGSSAPSCPQDEALQEFDKLDKAERKALIESFKKVNPTEEKIEEGAKASYTFYRDICMSMRAQERASWMLIGGCKGKECGPSAPNGAEIIGIEGLLVQNLKEMHSAKKNLLKDEKAANDAEKTYIAAQKAYKRAAEKHAEEPSDATRKALTDAARNLVTPLKDLAKAGGDLGKSILAKEQITRIDQILEAMTTGKYDKDAIKTTCAVGSGKGGGVEENDGDCKLAQATVVVAQLPTFIDRFDYILTLSEAPPLSGLLLEKSRWLILQQQADKNVKRRQREIEILEANARIIAEELALLYEANTLLNELPSDASQMTSEEFTNPKTNVHAKETMLLALAKYLRTFTGPKRQLHANEYRLLALQHEGAVDYSEASLNVWKSTIEIPVSALLAYHEGGLKPKDIIELLKALGLIGIAVGVF